MQVFYFRFASFDLDSDISDWVIINITRSIPQKNIT